MGSVSRECEGEADIQANYKVRGPGNESSEMKGREGLVKGKDRFRRAQGSGSRLQRVKLAKEESVSGLSLFVKGAVELMNVNLRWFLLAVC